MHIPTFWDTLDKLVKESKVMIEIQKGTNPVNSEAVFPTNYGYLMGTASSDGEGIDVFVGSDPREQVDAILCTVDLAKRDSEIKILIGCTEEEKRDIVHFYETHLTMKGLLVARVFA